MTPKYRCARCGEVFAGRGSHDCSIAREARRLFEAAKRANDPDTREWLSRRALGLAVRAEGIPA